MGVLMLALATVRISLNLSQNKDTSGQKGHSDSLFVCDLSCQSSLGSKRDLGILQGDMLSQSPSSGPMEDSPVSFLHCSVAPQ